MLTDKLPFQWKIQSYNKDKTSASCVAYIDARDVMDMLDKNGKIWKDEYKIVSISPEKYVIECTLSIFDGEWISRSDVGIGESPEVEKSAYSDAFKRAAVKWGIGRFLYDQNIIWIAVDDRKQPILKDKRGTTYKSLADYCNAANDYLNNR